MKKAILFLLALGLHAQSLSITLKGLTPTQATIVYHQSGTCTPTVTALASGTGFWGAQTRGVTGLTTSTLLDGSTMLVLGSGPQANLLPFNAAINVAVSCNSGAQTGSISFTTPSPQPGDGVRHTQPYNAASNGNYDLPTVDPNNPKPLVLENGSTVVPVNLPYGFSHHEVLGNATVGCSGWTNASNINSGTTGSLASVAGTGVWTSNPCFIPFANLSGSIPLMTGPSGIGLGTWESGSFTLDDLRANIRGDSTSGSAVVHICPSMLATIGGCSFPANAAATLATGSAALQQFPSGANWPGTVLGKACFFCDWGWTAAQLPQQWQLSVAPCTVSVSSSVVTATAGGPIANGQGCFDMLTGAVGGKAVINGSIYTIASFQSSSQLTIVESLTGLTGVNFQNSPGWVVWITDSVTSTASLSVSTDFAYSSTYASSLEGNQGYCNKNPQMVSFAADGTTPITPVPALTCGFPLNSFNYSRSVGPMFWFFPTTGEYRYMGPFYLFNGSDAMADQLVSNGYPGVNTVMFQDFWDNSDPNTFYFSGTTNGTGGGLGVTALFRGVYNAAAHHWKAYDHTLYPADDNYTYLTGECYNGGTPTGGVIYPGQDCTQPSTKGPQWSDQGITYTNLTKASASNSVDEQIAMNNSNYSSTLFSAATPQRIQGGVAVYISAPTTGGQTIALYNSFPTSVSETSATQIAASSSVAQFACGNNHSNYQNLNEFQAACNPLGGAYSWSGGPSVLGSGPFQTTPTCVVKSSSCNTDTSMTPTVPNDVCPSIPASVAPFAFTLTNGGTHAASNVCMTMQFQQPCSLNPAPGESAKWPCDWGTPGTQSKFRNMQVGDALAINVDVPMTGNTMELLLLLTPPTLISGTTYQATFMRGTEYNFGAQIGGPLTITTGWNAFWSPPTCPSQWMNQSTCGVGMWNDMGTSAATVQVDPGAAAGHYDMGTGPGPTPNSLSYFQSTAGRYNMPFATQVGQPFTTSMAPPSFAGQVNGMNVGVNLQGYPSLRQVSASGQDLNYLLNQTPPNPSQGAGSEIPAQSCANTVTLVGGAGYTTVYKFTVICGGLNYKLAQPQVTAGPYLLQDVSSPSCLITDSTPWQWCYVYVAGEGHAGSAVNTIYASIPNANLTLGGCGENWMDDRFVCGLSASPLAGSISQWRIDTTDNLGTRTRTLGTGGVALGTGFQFSSAIPEPTGQYAFYVQNWGLGWRQNGFMAMRLPPAPGSDTVNRTQFIPLTVTIPPGTCGASCFAQFGYAQYSGSALTQANLYCSPRSETCTTDATGAAPWLYTTSDTQQPTSCASGCKLTINLMPGMGEAWYSLNGTGPLVQIQ